MSSYILIIYVVAFIAIFYFMAIRPQQRQRRAHQALLSSLKKGDTVVTAAGIYGKVKRVEDDFVVIEVAKGVSMKITRRAVVEIVRDNAQARAVSPEGAGGGGGGKGRRGRAQIEETTDDYDTEAAENQETADAEESDTGEATDDTQQDT